MQKSEGACLLTHILHLCMKFRMQNIDTEDIMVRPHPLCLDHTH